ncbi:MAG: plasmid mobilization relaxosome protein MobC [Oscillospiraceae bacterium]|nr:plasmid mobilization relaxosome protein MobC [Oscillospiraceae bacterium]
MSRKRNVQVIFWVSDKERDLIEEKMAQLGTENMSAYLRKIAIDGYIVKLELPELREMVSLLRRTSNNINQLAKRVNETGRVYAADMDDILQNQERLWQAASDIITRLAAIK